MKLQGIWKLDSARKVAAEKKRLLDRLAEINRETEQIIYNSPAQRLERLRLEKMALLEENHNIARAEKNLIQAAPLPAEYAELIESIKRSLAAEREISGQLHSLRIGFLNSSYIRSDAVAHFQAERDEAEASLEKLMRPFRNSNTVFPTGRTLVEKTQLENAIDDWERSTKKLAAAGERIFALRQERAALEKRRDEIVAQREQQALQVA